LLIHAVAGAIIRSFRPRKRLAAWIMAKLSTTCG
jgi:hypothetical protein